MNDYSVEKFYTKSTDGHGHRVNARTQIPPGVAAQVSQVIASRRVPEYKTPGDLYRDAIYHRLHWLAEEYCIEDLEVPLSLWAVQNELERRREERESAEKIVKMVREEWHHARSGEERIAAKDARDRAMLVLPEPYRSDLAHLQ